MSTSHYFVLSAALIRSSAILPMIHHYLPVRLLRDKNSELSLDQPSSRQHTQQLLTEKAHGLGTILGSPKEASMSSLLKSLDLY